MRKIKLSETSKDDFIKYAKERRERTHLNYKNMNHLTDEILSNTFDFFTKHNLTVEANAKSYYTLSGKREHLCYGYSGYSAGCRDDDEGIIHNLYHEVWCQAEWLARGKMGGYIDVVKATFGARNYNYIVGGVAI